MTYKYRCITSIQVKNEFSKNSRYSPESTGNNNHYKAGSILTITATTNERAYIKNNENLSNATIEATPLLGINFGGTAAKGTIKCIKVENVNNQTMFTY